MDARHPPTLTFRNFLDKTKQVSASNNLNACARALNSHNSLKYLQCTDIVCLKPCRRSSRPSRRCVGEAAWLLDDRVSLLYCLLVSKILR
jgi:hypothetical protein